MGKRSITPNTLKEVLPHGSGFNCDWHVSKKRNKIIATSCYETMTESGMYDAVVDFTLEIPQSKPEAFKLKFNGKLAQRQNKKYGLRDYIEDEVAQSIRELK